MLIFFFTRVPAVTIYGISLRQKTIYRGILIGKTISKLYLSNTYIDGTSVVNK